MALSALTYSQPRPPTSPGARATTTEEQEELAFGQVWKDAGTQKHSTTARPKLDERRKSSIQFNTAPAEEAIRRGSTTAPSRPHKSSMSGAQGRNPSPPPPMPFTRGIAFDTFQTPDAPAEAFSIQYKHQDFTYTPRTRTFIVGTDAKDYSEYALEWALDELVDDGDEIVCLRVVAEDSSERRNYKDEADRLLDSVVQKNVIERKAICLKMELAVGKVTDVIQSMIQLYEPVAIIVGTRGRALTGVQGLRGGSVSKYCLQRSPVPTIVVRPSSKRSKKKMKRQQEIGRAVYSNMLSRAQNVRSSHVREHSIGDGYDVQGAEGEAEAVQNAVGTAPAGRKGILRNRGYGGPLARVTSRNSVSDESDEDNTPAQPSFALPIGFLTMESAPTAEAAMKSPLLQSLGENWEDSPKSGSRAQSPAPGLKPTTSAAGNKAPSDSALTDNEGDSDDAHPTIIDHRRPSTRSQTPWLNAILAKPEPRPTGTGPVRRSVSMERRGHSRSRSR